MEYENFILNGDRNSKEASNPHKLGTPNRVVPGNKVVTEDFLRYGRTMPMLEEKESNMTKTYINLEVQYKKLFRHLKVGSFKTRERYGKAFKRFMHFLANEYNLQKLANIAPKHIFAYVEYMQNKGLSASTIKTELAAIRFFHDSMPYTRFTLPANDELSLEKRKFGGVDRTWTDFEFKKMLAVTALVNHPEYIALFYLGRYAGLRLEECFRIDTNDAKKALKTEMLFVKGKGGLQRYVPVNPTIQTLLDNMLKVTPVGEKLFVRPYDDTHLAMKRLQNFIINHRKEFTERKITFHGLRHTYAHGQYEKFIKEGCSEFDARKNVSELLGHHRDDVTRIYLSGGV